MPEKAQPDEVVLPGGLARWAFRAAQRLAMLKLPGVYTFLIIVHADGSRQLIVQNADRPHKLEELGEP